MKKRISLLVSTLALVALASFAQAAPGTKFAVQGPDGAVTPVDNFTVSDTGVVYATKIGINTTTPIGAYEGVVQWANQGGTNIHSVFTSYGDASRLTVRRANGTKATPTASISGDMLGNVNFRGFDGTNFSTSGVAAIQGYAEAAFTPTSQPTRIAFFTTAPNAIVGTERLRIASDGRIRISAQPVAPANTAACTTGDLILDAANGFLYLCTATNSWKRTAFAAY